MSHNTISLSCYFQLLYILKHTCTVHCQINMTDLFLIMQTLDGDFFDQLRGYFTTLGQVEVDACNNAMLGFETVVSHANTVSWIVFNDGVKMKLVVDLMKNPGIVGCIHSFPFCSPFRWLCTLPSQPKCPNAAPVQILWISLRLSFHAALLFV